MTVEVNSKGIKRVIDEPKFGEITDPEEVLKLVEQNKEVFINGKTLYQTFTDMVKSVNEQQTPAEETFTKDSPQSATPSSSGDSSLNTPSSRRSSLSISSEFNGEDEIFESDTFSDEEENKQEGNELEEENTYLKKENAELKSRNTKITEEGEAEASQLIEGKQDLEKEVTRLKDELKRKEKELAEKDQDIKKLELEVNVLEQSEKDKNARITDLINQLKDKENEIQSTNRINEELQKKLDQGETELSKLKEENTELINITKRILETDNNEKLLVEELKEKIDNLVKELNEVNIKNKDLEGKLERKNEDSERKIQQPEPGRSLADEMSEVNTNEEIDKLKQQLKAKDDMLTHKQEELKSVKEALEKLQDILQQEKDLAAISTQTKIKHVSKGIQASDQETTVPKTQDQGTQAADKSSSKRISKLEKENKNLARDKLTIPEQLKQKIKEIGELKKNSKQLQEENKQLKQEVIPQNIMDWPVPIPDDKPEEQKTPLEPIKVNTELSDPKSIPAEAPEKSTPSKG